MRAVSDLRARASTNVLAVRLGYTSRVQDVIEKIRTVLDRGPPLRLAVVFGSEAKGRVHLDSDVDLAILPVHSDLDPHTENQLSVEISRALGREVDVVRLDRASTYLRWQIARDCVPVFAKTDIELVQFRSSAASEYADIADTLVNAARRFRRRILETGS
jgi:uncharacterized protein